MKNSENLRKLTLTALFVALTIIVNMFTRINITVGGVTLVRIQFSGPLLAFISVVCGPFYGGVAAAVVDVISFIMKPDGAFMWPFTLIAFLKFFGIGLLWKYVSVSAKATKPLKVGYIAVFLFAMVAGVFNLLAVKLNVFESYNAFLALYEKEVVFMTYGLIVFSALGLVLYGVVEYLLKNKTDFKSAITLLIAVGVPSVTATIVTTFVLRGLGGLSFEMFLYILMPRIIKESIVVIYNVYMLAVLLAVYSKIKSTKLA